MSATDGAAPPPDTGAADDGDDGDEPPSGRRGRGRGPWRRRNVLLAVGAVVLVIALLGLWVAFGGERARPSSEEEARRRLGSLAATGSSVARDTGATLAAPPSPGLYRYEGDGREHTSTPPLTEELGPKMPATVLPKDDRCWVVRIDYNTHHWDDTTYCTGEGRLVERGGTTFSRKVLGAFTIDNLSTFTCEPVALWERGDAPGTKRKRSCSGTGTYVTDTTTATGTVTVVGTERIDVGGESVATVHVHYDVDVGGAQRGTETTDMWFETGTGLPVRNERHIAVTSSSPIGDIAYAEDGRYHLTSPRPV